MNSKFVRQCMGLAVGLGLFGGCAKPSAQPNQPPVVTAAGPAPIVVQEAPLAPTPPANAAPAGVATTPGAPAVPTADEPAPKVEQRIPPAQPANIATGVDEVAKLAQGGVSEEIILTYIEKYPARFNVSADQIVYLNDLGVSTVVVNAMLKHDGAAAPAPTAPADVAQQTVSNAPQIPVNPGPQTEVQVGGNAPIATAPAAPSTEVSYFYDSLSPYGSWIYVSGYGWCWQPTVAVRVSTWQPYCDSGRWYWSDTGWYWHSDYSWGWAPFHYGRWYRHSTCGWIWTPGTVWGPAWVSWRYSDGYCGWAPLPPAAVWIPGGGFSYHGRHVAVGFDFGLSFHHYAFVSVDRFCDPRPWSHRVPRTQVVNVYRNTTVINNYRVSNGNVVNNGVSRETIARRNANEFREVKVQRASFAGTGDRMNRIERRGNDLVAYRSELPKEPPVKPAVVQTRMAQQARVARVNENTTRDTSAPRAGRNNVVERDGRDNRDVRDGRGAATPATPRSNVGGNESRPNVGNPEPRNSSPGRSAPEPRNTPQRNPQERNRSAETRNNNQSVARLNETAPSPNVAAPRTQSPANTVTPRAATPTPSPRVERQTVPQARSAPESRSPAVTAPSVPRTAPSYSPRYNEQHYNAPTYRAPAQAAPSYSPPPAAVAPRSVAPPQPRSEAPAARSGGGGGAVERGNGGGGGSRSDGAGNHGGGRGGRDR